MKISKSSSAKYYQDNKKRLQKNACEKKNKEKNMVINDTDVYKMMRNKSWLSIKKYCKKRRKSLIIIIRNVFLVDRLFF